MKTHLVNLIDFLSTIWAIITIKDPCKKCIVRACCSTSCEYKTILDNFLFPYNLLYKSKIRIICNALWQYMCRIISEYPIIVITTLTIMEISLILSVFVFAP